MHLHPTLQLQWTRLKDWLARAEPWQIALAAVVLTVVILPPLPAILLILASLFPVLLLVAIGLALYRFALAWNREFQHLMRLDDADFPGQNDKLIWAILLIVLPPAGVLMFRPFRERRWPSSKPTDEQGSHDLF